MNDIWRRRPGINASIFYRSNCICATGATAFVLAETDGDNDTESAGEGSTFVVGTGVSKAIIKDNGAADTVFED